MIDIHCHILPGFDDGPAVHEESLRMAAIAAADGISRTVSSPHFSYGTAPSFEDVRAATSALQEEIRRSGIVLELVCGADVRLTYELKKGLERRDVPTINGSRYFLLELPDIIPPKLESIFFAALSNGYTPVITHPERNRSLLVAPGKIGDLRESGCLFQITAMSVTGEFGEMSMDCCLKLLRDGLCDFIASDAHDISQRTPVLSRAFGEISRAFGEDRARRLFFENPLAVLEDREVSS